MTSYRRGDVILVKFVFSDETGEKRRPAVLLSSNVYNQGRNEAIISAITGNTDRILVGDYLIKDWKSAGLLFPSVATGIIRTIKQDMIVRKLGALTANDVDETDKILRSILELTQTSSK